MAQPAPPPPIGLFGLLLRAGLFLIFIRYTGALLGSVLNEVVGILAAAALSIFLAAALASAFVVRTFERGRIEDIGMAWGPKSLRHLWLGLAGGALSALAVMLLPVALQLATIVPAADTASVFTPGKFLFVSVALLFGAVGEEMMFRGYAFQLLLRAYGPWWVIPPFGLLFAAAHLLNLGVSPVGMLNTALWGIVFGYAVYRSGDLWLAIGLHFGWNWMLPLFGVNLSGFTMGLSGYTLRWTAGPLISGGDYGVEGSLLATAAVGLLGVWLWRARLERQPAPLLEHPTNTAPDDSGA